MRSVTTFDCISNIACRDEGGTFFGMSSRLDWPKVFIKPCTPASAFFGSGICMISPTCSVPEENCAGCPVARAMASWSSGALNIRTYLRA